MITIPYVQANEPIYANTINSLIDNQNQMCRDYSRPFRQDDRGITYFDNPIQTVGQSVDSDDEGLNPFDVDYISSDSYTGYMIYLPDGCVSLGGTYETFNKEISGVEDIYWHKLIVEDEAYPVISGLSGEPKVYAINIYSKPWCQNYNQLSDENTPKYLAACIPVKNMSETAKNNLKNIEAGAFFTNTVGYLSCYKENDLNSYVYENIQKTQLAGTYSTVGKGMDLYWQFQEVPNNNYPVFISYYIKNRVFTAAGGMIEMQGSYPISDNAKRITVKLMCESRPLGFELTSYTAAELSTQEIISQRQGDDFTLYVDIYDLENYKMNMDLRDNLHNIQIYR